MNADTLSRFLVWQFDGLFGEFDMKLNNIFSISLLVLLVGCTHTIAHKPLQNTLPASTNDLSAIIVVPPESKAFTATHSNLSGDKWIFEVGHALVDIVPQVFRNHYGSVLLTDTVPPSFVPTAKKHLVVLKINSFKPDIGWTVFSKHDGALTVSVESKGKKTITEEVTGAGSDSGGNYAKTFGGLLLPSVGISGYNEAMSVMISNAVTATSVKALEVAEKAAG